MYNLCFSQGLHTCATYTTVIETIQHNAASLQHYSTEATKTPLAYTTKTPPAYYAVCTEVECVNSIFEIINIDGEQD